MSSNRLPDYVEHIEQAATDAISFIDSLDFNDFLTDKRTQQAVIMSILIIGEASTKIMNDYPDFTESHPEIPWRIMRNMRNRIAHGYFDIDLEVVWNTVQQSLPDLLKLLPGIRKAAQDHMPKD